MAFGDLLQVCKIQIKWARVVSPSLAVLAVYFNLAVDRDLWPDWSRRRVFSDFSDRQESGQNTRETAKGTRDARKKPKIKRAYLVSRVLGSPAIFKWQRTLYSYKKQIVHTWAMERSRQKYIHWFKIKTFNFWLAFFFFWLFTFVFVLFCFLINHWHFEGVSCVFLIIISFNELNPCNL